LSHAKLGYIYPDWSAPRNVKALVSTRAGGFSVSPFDTFNLGLHTGDNAATVMKNRQALLDSGGLPAEPTWLNQTHSNKIIELSDVTDKGLLDYDGAITKTKGVVCAVMTADCLPLFLCDEDGQQVGVLHVGWRGLAGGIIQKGLNMFNCESSQLLAWAGPCIGKAHFEIGEEVKHQLGGLESAYNKSCNRGKYYADLVALTGEVLADCGVKQYSHSSSCTYKDENLFYSYRRDKVTGRMVSLIWLE